MTTSEKNTQYLLMKKCEELGLTFNTSGNNDIFQNSIPDGWIIDEKRGLLLVFECKQKNQRNKGISRTMDMKSKHSMVVYLRRKKNRY